MAWFRDDLGNNRDVNDPETQFDIDVEHYNEAGVTPDYSEAAKLCKLAAEQGHAPAQYNLGFMYEMGQGVEQDASESLKWYRTAADNGYAPAQLELGEMYESGAVGARDYGDAVKWYRLAADQGNADAQLKLGNMYREGQGVSQDYNEAANWYRLAGEQEHSEAQYNLGRMYESGSIGAIDYEEATKWYRLAADQGHPEATNELKKGEPKSIPEGVVEQQPHPRTSEQKSPKQPEPILEEPSKITDPETQYEIGNKYYKGEDVIRDYNEAAKWYRLAADQGDADAQYNLAIMYYYGQGVTQDYSEAAKWYRLAAKQGHEEAIEELKELQGALARRYELLRKSNKSDPKQNVSKIGDHPIPEPSKITDPETQYAIGNKYYKGEDVVRDYNEAAKWYRLAADRGDADAQYNLAIMHYYGQGVTPDYSDAAKWYRLAADQGHEEAIEELKELQGALARRDELLRQSDKSIPKQKESQCSDPTPQDISDKTDPETQYEIGNKYYKGEEVIQDYSEAAKWYRLAAEQGNANAQTSLGLMNKNGHGFIQDNLAALWWFGLAAEQGDALAQYNLGQLYEIGPGMVLKDYTEAIKCYQLAADQGHAQARAKLKELEQNLTQKDTLRQKSDESDVEKKVSLRSGHLPEDLNDKTDPETQFEIGNKYYSGLEVTRNYSEAVKWYRLAANQGYANAQCNARRQLLLCTGDNYTCAC